MHVSGDRPLLGKRVLITRAVEQSESFASVLRAHGAQPIVAPTIAIRALDDLSALDDAIARLADFSWLVFTSQNAVDIVMPRLRSRNARLGALRIAAIGRATANRLNEHGATVTLTAKQHVSEALASELVRLLSRGQRVLLVRALEGRDVLPNALDDAGILVTAVPAYRTMVVRDPMFAAKVCDADTVTFTSASTVRAFSTLLHGRAGESVEGKCVACIGPVTAEAARRVGLPVDVTAAQHTVAGLVDALRAHYGATA